MNENGIIVWYSREQWLDLVAAGPTAFFQLAQEPCRSCPVGLGKHHVKGGAGGSQVLDTLQKFGNLRTRPRPLAQLRYRLLVDVDDPDRLPQSLPRFETLIGVEGDPAQGRYERGIGQA